MTAKGQQELEVWEELDRNLIALLTSGWGQERICFHETAMRREEEAAEKNTCESKMLAWEIGFLSRISELETGREPTWMSKASHLRSTPSGSWTPGAPLRSAITPGGETEASWEEKIERNRTFSPACYFFSGIFNDRCHLFERHRSRCGVLRLRRPSEIASPERSC